MSNDFEKCMQIAEFAQRNQHDRRQYEFKIFISYVTLLVLGIYRADKIDIPCEFGLLLVWVSYILYFIWNVKLALANYNDETRRNYYLAKAEVRLCLSDNVKPVPTEYDRPPCDKIMRFGFKKAWCAFWNNWSIWFTTLLPVLLIILLTIKLLCK